MGIILFLVIAFAAWRYSAYRGLLFIRAFVFIKGQQDGLSLNEANEAASLLTPALAVAFGDQAKSYARHFHRGRQLNVIAAAKRSGFVTNKLTSQTQLQPKNIAAIVAALSLSACATSYDSPEIQSALNVAMDRLDDCLILQLSKLDDGSVAPETVAWVAADRCEATAYHEAIKLTELNTSKAFIEGFNGKLTDKTDIASRALDIDLTVRRLARDRMRSGKPPRAQ